MSCLNDDLAVKCANCDCDRSKPKIVAVIPTHGRFALVRHNIRRLKQRNGIHEVVIIGNQPEIEKICQEEGAIYCMKKNNPLGAKWNFGFTVARMLKPDAILFVGSSDFISDDWLKVASGYLKDYDLIGKLGCHLLDVNTMAGKRLCYWPGYLTGPRAEEPIGIGRVISARVLDKIDWQPFENSRENSMDWFMYDRILNNAGKVKIMTEDVHSMAISTNLWPNKHSFDTHWRGQLKSDKIKDKDTFLNKYFPDAINLNLKGK